MLQADFKSIAFSLIPKWMRKPTYLLLIDVGSLPFRSIMNSFQNFMIITDYRLAHNSQKCYLQAVLNDQFDTTERRIRIVNFISEDNIYLFPDSMNLNIYLGEIYLGVQDAGIDFTILIPIELMLSDNQLNLLKGLMNVYRQTKYYNIIYV